MKACPVCGRLVYTDQLVALAQAAEEAKKQEDYSSALAAWREAIELLPSDSKQYQVISAKIDDLGRRLPLSVAATMPRRSSSEKGPAMAATAGIVGVVAWTVKAMAMGLTKVTTLFSMLLSVGVYWTLWSWQFALGLVLSIYVHEMGHVIALKRYGFRTSGPMFIPGLGALVRLQQRVLNPREDAAIGLAGPVFGLGAAGATLGFYALTQEPIWAAIAGVGAWINLFNLLPIASLDGGRGFHAMSRGQRLLAAAAMAGCWAWTHDGLLMLIAIVCFLRVGEKNDTPGNWKATLTYCGLAVALTAISTVRPMIEAAQ